MAHSTDPADSGLVRPRLTAKDVLQFAEHAYPRETDDATLLCVLRAVAGEASATAKRRALQQLIRTAETFRPADHPGHEVWYPHHIQVAARAVRILGS